VVSAILPLAGGEPGRLFPLLTRFTGAKGRNHRTEAGFAACWAYLVMAIYLLAASPNLSLAQAIL